jgi:glycosyltransferase involved in cell wall biosynthesis
MLDSCLQGACGRMVFSHPLEPPDRRYVPLLPGSQALMFQAVPRSPPARLRIAIATAGRFHVLDLARELAALGHDVRLYSILPHAHAEIFGLDRRFHRSLLAYVAPLVAWQRFAPCTLPDIHGWLFTRALDRTVTALLEPCDVLIAMSGIYVRALRAAKRRYGARVWLERGSRHILSQAEILAAVPGARGPTSDIIARELEGYRLADRIVVPGRHVAESFERDPAAHSKLFVNPYGTNLDTFPHRERSRRSGGRVRLIFAGAWSRRKGCDVLEAAIRRCEGVELRHVGIIGDQPFPSDDDRFVHFDAVPQSALAAIYHDCHVFVHASREEGLSVVLAQALASGLPLICTDHTGGSDLAHTPVLRDYITVVPHNDAPALARAIRTIADALTAGWRPPDLSAADREALSWKAYAVRYERELQARSQAASINLPFSTRGSSER